VVAVVAVEVLLLMVVTVVVMVASVVMIMMVIFSVVVLVIRRAKSPVFMCGWQHIDPSALAAWWRWRYLAFSMARI
jgi:hypothetical protein